jgi:hypothetical protein
MIMGSRETQAQPKRLVLDDIADLLQPLEHKLVAVHKAQAAVLDLCLCRKRLDELLTLTQVVPGDAGEQVVHGLELQAAVEPVEPDGAVDVHGGAKLALRERLDGSEVRRRHAPVGQRDLDVQDNGDNVRGEHKGNAVLPRRERAPTQQVAEDVPVAAHECDLDGASPPRGAELLRAWRHEMQPAEEVEVEARERHDGVVPPLLVGNEQVARTVPDEAEVVEGREDRLHVGGGGAEERDVLDVRVVFGHVGDEMVHVVRRLPPADAKTAAEIGNEGADEGVVDKVSSDTTVAGVVGCEHDLLLEKS